MIRLHSAMWDAEGRTGDGYAVACWRGAFTGQVTARVDYPHGGRFKAIACAFLTEAEAVAFAEGAIREERAARAGAATP